MFELLVSHQLYGVGDVILYTFNVNFMNRLVHKYPGMVESKNIRAVVCNVFCRVLVVLTS